MDDSSDFRAKVRYSLAIAFSVVEAGSVGDFRRVFRAFAFDLVILDMRLENEREGLGLLREILAADPLQAVIMVSAYGDCEAVLDAAEAGALMFLHKQEFSPELLVRMVEAVLQQARVRRHLASLERRVRVEDPLGLSVGNPAVERADELVEDAARQPRALVVVHGPAGAGHELAATAIHHRSARRRTAPLVVLGAGAAQPLDLGRRLFGEQMGGGGLAGCRGLMAEANWGLLFIDRFDELGGEIQERVLRAVAEGRIDGGSPVPLDLQLVLGAEDVTASAVLAAKVAGVAPGTRVIEIALPALRERREDIPLLAAYFLQELRREGRTTAQAFAKEALAALESWDWPGNLLELKSVIAFAGVQALVADEDAITCEHMPRNLLDRWPPMARERRSVSANAA